LSSSRQDLRTGAGLIALTFALDNRKSLTGAWEEPMAAWLAWDISVWVRIWKKYRGVLPRHLDHITKQNWRAGIVFFSADRKGRSRIARRGRPQDPLMISQISLRLATLEDLRTMQNFWRGIA
jgi:hypothetical protein